MPTPPVHFRCINDNHGQGPSAETVDTLTVYDGKWAYCPFDVRAADHRWQPTGGVPLERLVPMGRHLTTSGGVSPSQTPSPEPPRRPSAPSTAKASRSRRRA